METRNSPFSTGNSDGFWKTEIPTIETALKQTKHKCETPAVPNAAVGQFLPRGTGPCVALPHPTATACGHSQQPRHPGFTSGFQHQGAPARTQSAHEVILLHETGVSATLAVGCFSGHLTHSHHLAGWQTLSWPLWAVSKGISHISN